MKTFDYERATTIAAAIDAAAGLDTRLLAGGTDLLPLMKAGITSPGALIDIKRIKELDRVEDAGETTEIGALATLRTLEFDPLIGRRFPLLARAAALAASPQIRNRATTGGNILQRPRCWYFREESIDCWLKGGEHCPAREGENQLHALFGQEHCVAVQPSDLATAFVALKASVRLESEQGARTVPAAEFFTLPTPERRVETVLAEGEVVTGISLPNPAANARMGYDKAMERGVWTFAMSSVAAVTEMDSRGTVANARIVLGGVAPRPWRAEGAELALAGQQLSADVIRRAAEAATDGAAPLSNNAYKVQLVQGQVTRVLESLASP